MSKKKSSKSEILALFVVIAVFLSGWVVAVIQKPENTKAMNRYLCKVGEIDHDWGEWVLRHKSYEWYSDAYNYVTGQDVVRSCSRCGKEDRYVPYKAFSKIEANLARICEEKEKLQKKVFRLEQELSRLTNSVPIGPEITWTNFYLYPSSNDTIYTTTCLSNTVITSDSINIVGTMTCDDIEAKKITYDKLIKRGKRWWEFWK